MENNYNCFSEIEEGFERAKKQLEECLYNNTSKYSPTLTVTIVNPGVAEMVTLNVPKWVDHDNYRVFIQIFEENKREPGFSITTYEQIFKIPAILGDDAKNWLRDFLLNIIESTSITSVESAFIRKGTIRGDLFKIDISNDENLTLRLPKNDLSYLEVIERASNKSLDKCFDVLKLLKSYGYEPNGYVENTHNCSCSSELNNLFTSQFERTRVLPPDGLEYMVWFAHEQLKWKKEKVDRQKESEGYIRY